MERRIAVLVDDRERAGPVPAELARSAIFEVQVRRLPLGDYLVDGRFLFERKTLPDLAASIASGRLFSQTLRLAEAEGVRPALILEGTSKNLEGCGMRWEAIQGALIRQSVHVVSPSPPIIPPAASSFPSHACLPPPRARETSSARPA